MVQRLVTVTVTATLVGCLVAPVGCGGKKAWVKGGKEASVTYDSGGVEAGGEEERAGPPVVTITEADLDVPIYPGLVLDEDDPGTISTRNERGETVWSGAVLLTGDPLETVIKWYRMKLSGRPGFRDLSSRSGTDEIGMFTIEPGDEPRLVTVAAGGEERPGMTVITIGESDPATP